MGIVKIRKRKKKGEPRDNSDCVPPPFELQRVRKTANELSLPSFTFFNRLTLVFSSQDAIQKYLKSNNYKKYDIIGVIPTSAQAFAFTCSNLEADILTFDPQNRMNLKINRKAYFQLVDRGYYFELPYSYAIEDSTKRKNLIYLSHLYHTYGKSRNIIFSSGAEDSFLLRSPYDIICLGFLFGLKELQTKCSVSELPRKVTLNALGRRHGKAVMFVENIEDKTQANEGDDAIVIDSDDNGNMDTDQPAQKRPKQ